MFGDGFERLAEENLVTIQMLRAAILLRPGRYFAVRLLSDSNVTLNRSENGALLEYARRNLRHPGDAGTIIALASRLWPGGIGG
jgi:hypothetical protein